MHKGKLIVSGNGEARIELNGFPVKMNVDFSDEEVIYVPCNPHHFDKLEWEINHHILIIRWVVSNVREIEWRAQFYWV